MVTNSSGIISGAHDLLGADDAPDTGDDNEVRAWRVDAGQHGERLDKVLAAAISEFSRNYLKQLIEQGAVERNGEPQLKVSVRVKAGDAMRVSLRPTPQSQAFKPEAMALGIVHQDADLLVILKPAGLVVHPAPGNWSGTLLNGLLAWDARQGDLPRAGIVHRLDKDTSGLMLVARSRPAMDALVRMISAREVQRQYLALAHGRWDGLTNRDVHASIGRDPRNRLRMAVLDADKTGAKEARTMIERLDSNDQHCLVRCSLHTGRTHQIRVHMASIGHPLVGDETYGGQGGTVIARQALHAFRLALAHPISDKALQFVTPMPDDMQQALTLVGLRYNSR